MRGIFQVAGMGMIISRLKRKMLRAMGYSVPMQLWIGVTYKCQCRCEHCGVSPMTLDRTIHPAPQEAIGVNPVRNSQLSNGVNQWKNGENSPKGNNLEATAVNPVPESWCGVKPWSRVHNELSTEEIKRLITEAKNCYIPTIVFFGGEPLLRDDLIELIAYTTSLALRSVVYTNGILLNDEKVGELKKAGVSKCNVSLDSSNEELHDNFRGYKGCYESAVSGIRRLVKAGIECSIWTHVSKEDVRDNELADLKRLIELSKGLGVNSIMILFPMTTGKWLTNTEALLSMSEREKVRKLYAPPFVCMEFPDEGYKCRAGKFLIYITPSGDVSPCPAIPHSFGNIRQQSLRNILKKVNSDVKKFSLCSSGECVMNQDTFLCMIEKERSKVNQQLERISRV